MGYIRHAAVIAIGYPYDEAASDAMRAEIDALRSEMGEHDARILLGPISTVINGDEMYVYLPDGSKEGWDTSDAHDEWRATFREIVNRQRWWTVLSVEFGGDDADYLTAEVVCGGEPYVAVNSAASAAS